MASSLRVRRYHRLELTLPKAPLIDGPALFVADHGSGGIFDLNVFAGLAGLDRLQLSRPVIALTHQIAWTLRVGRIVEALGARPASRDVALEALARRDHVLVLPGGDIDGGKCFVRRNEIVWTGRCA
jgi:hypothetical protein